MYSVLFLLFCVFALGVVAQNRGGGGGGGSRDGERGGGRGSDVNEYRAIDGSNNNENSLRDHFGETHQYLERAAGAAFTDGMSTMPRDLTEASPRFISNALCQYPANRTLSPSSFSHTNLVWVWGQFIDHVVALTEPPHDVDLIEPFNMVTPPNDPILGSVTIPFTRAGFDAATGTNADNPRQYFNELNGLIDGSAIYGSTEDTASKLRTFQDGLLKSQQVPLANGLTEELLPFNVDADVPLAGNPDHMANHFAAGDIRINENVLLTAMHTLWVREHNRIAAQIKERYEERNIFLTDEEIYQEARIYVIAEVQAITYEEWLPELFGDALPSGLRRYDRYNSDVNPNMAVEFTTVAFRIGHTMLPNVFQASLSDPSQTLELRDMFFNPAYVTANGIDELLGGASDSLQEEIDGFIIEDVRSFLFGNPLEAGSLMDLASFNLQRGRDLGVPDYNTLRRAYNLPTIESFDELNPSRPELGAILASLYTSVDQIDPWVAGLLEEPIRGSPLGPLFARIMGDQFERSRNGDRFYYERLCPRRVIDRDHEDCDRWVREMHDTTLEDVIRRNTRLNIDSDAFVLRRRD